MRSLPAFLSTALFTLTLAGSAFAQTAAPTPSPEDFHRGGHHHHHAFDPARMTQRLDRNQNGRIEVAELTERQRARLAPADANRDGVLAPEELRAAFEARRAAMRAQMDTNRDGTISPDERRAAFEARSAARFARLDANGDGAATAAEVGAQRWSRIGRADANNDGRVTRDELRQARAARRGAAGPHGECRGPQGNHGAQ